MVALFLSCSKFDSRAWKEHSDESETDNPRWEMVDDLQMKLSESTMTETEIRELLGKPTYEKRHNNEIFLYYTVGWRFAFSIDPDFLVIRLNSNAIYVESWLEQY